MRFVLDTTVLVDVERGLATTTAWLARQDPEALYLSAITVGELVRGGCKRYSSDPGMRDSYLTCLREQLLILFPRRVLPFDSGTAEIWGRLMDEGAAEGRRPPPDDAKIAATTLRHGMMVATSNGADFDPLCPTLDPRTA